MGWPLATTWPGETRMRETDPLTCVITGVVSKLLYATDPVRRSIRGKRVFSAPTTWTCSICSSGTVKSCACPSPAAFAAGVPEEVGEA